MAHLDAFIRDRLVGGQARMKYFVFKQKEKLVFLAFEDSGNHRDYLLKLSVANPDLVFVAGSICRVKWEVGSDGTLTRLAVNGLADVATGMTPIELKAALWSEIKQVFGTRFTDRTEVVDHLRSGRGD